jgi:hypothetical protein
MAEKTAPAGGTPAIAINWHHATASAELDLIPSTTTSDPAMQ